MKNDGANLTLGKLKTRISHLHPGDIVEVMDEETGDFFHAAVERIYPNTVLFRKKTGMAFSLDYFSAAHLKIVNSAGYEARSSEMEMDDIAAALEETETKK